MSKIIHYSTKNNEGHPVIIKFYPSEEEMEKLFSILTSRIRPQQIEWRGNLLKSASIEIIDENAQERSDKTLDKFTATTQQIKDFISDFISHFESWFETQPIETRNIKYYIAAYPNLNRKWIYEKYAAWRTLFDRRKYAEKKELEALAPVPDHRASDEEIILEEIIN